MTYVKRVTIPMSKAEKIEILYKIFDDVCDTVRTMYNGKIPAIISGGLYDEREHSQFLRMKKRENNDSSL